MGLERAFEKTEFFAWFSHCSDRTTGTAVGQEVPEEAMSPEFVTFIAGCVGCALGEIGGSSVQHSSSFCIWGNKKLNQEQKNQIWPSFKSDIYEPECN